MHCFRKCLVKSSGSIVSSVYDDIDVYLDVANPFHNCNWHSRGWQSLLVLIGISRYLLTEIA